MYVKMLNKYDCASYAVIILRKQFLHIEIKGVQNEL